MKAPRRAPLTVAMPDAMEEVPSTVDRLLRRASVPGGPLLREWWEPAGTYLLHSRAEVQAGPELLDAAVEALFGDAPGWFGDRITGRSGTPVEPRGDVVRAQRSQVLWNIGMGQIRLYEQLVCLVEPEPGVRVVTRRSVDADGPRDQRQCYCQPPSGDVFRRVGGRLIWDHVVTSPGGGILPPGPDRILTNLLRWVGLDQAERNTYLWERAAFRKWAAKRS